MEFNNKNKKFKGNGKHLLYFFIGNTFEINDFAIIEKILYHNYGKKIIWYANSDWTNSQSRGTKYWKGQKNIKNRRLIYKIRENILMCSLFF